MMVRYALAGLLLLSGPAALAQDTSTVMPAAPAAPAGSGIVMPGAPMPAISGGAAAGESGAAPKGRSGYIIDEGSSLYGEGDAGQVSSAGPVGPVPDYHVVKKGDTLWDIAATYFKSPWFWPKLWSYNPAITNPHWIYPGDRVQLFPPSAAAPEPSEPVISGAMGGLPAATEQTAVRGLFLRQTAFLEPNELRVAGTIVGSREEKIMLGTLDEAYVSFVKDAPLNLEERYTVFRPDHEVVHPVSGKKLGTVVEILGELQVKAITDGRVARTVIIDSVNPIERGFRVGVLRRQFKMVAPRPAEEDLSGVVVTTLPKATLVGGEMLVFLDRGRKDGVRVGNRFLVTRRGDGYVPLLAKGPMDDRRFPRETVSEIIVVDLRDRVSAGLILGSIKDTRIGDRVELKKGR